MLSETTTKSTYADSVWVSGSVDPSVELSAQDAEVKRLSPKEFEWNFPAPEKGVFNKSFVDVKEDGKTWKAEYEIYRGYSSEISGRLSGILTSGFQILLLGEIAGQYWFEDIFGWKNYRFSKQRWGIAARYFNAFAETTGSSDTNLRQLSVGNVDLKYRLTPGVWQRDPHLRNYRGGTKYRLLCCRRG